MNFAEAILNGAGEVQGVGCAEKNGGGQRRIVAFDPRDDCLGKRQPAKDAALAFLPELPGDDAILAGSQRAFAQLAVQCSGHLGGNFSGNFSGNLKPGTPST